MAAAPASPPERNPDFFSIFGISRRFGVDRAALERRFYELSRATHPDRFTTAGAEAQREALARMSELNEAYRTLKDPAELRQYFLRLEGFDLGPEKPSVPAELAESWFEVQDAAMEDPATARERIAAFEKELSGLKDRGAEKLFALERRLDEAADAGSDRGAAAYRELLETLAREIQAQSYIKSMERDVERIKKRL